MPTLWRHSLFFLDANEADQAAVDAYYLIENEIVDLYQCEDTDTRITEVRFFTEGKVDDYDMRCLLASCPPSSYAFNCDDFI